VPRPTPADLTPSNPPYELVAIYRAHVQRVARWTGRLGGPLVDVEDVVQEVFLKVQHLLPGFRGDAELTTWLFRITENVVRHRRRRERLHRWLSGGSKEALAQLPSSLPSPLEQLERHEATGLVYRVLDSMREQARTVLILFDLEGLSGDELEQLTGVKAATLRVRLHRARAEFAARLARLEKQSARGRAR
jgi:RNA polymerase sigma-70 factor (ECF subfamily)